MGYSFYNPYIQINKESSSSLNKQIGWMICESTPINEDEIGPVKIDKDSSNGRRVLGIGRLQRANKKNRNGRFYADKELFPELKCARTLELLKSGFGSENGHPMDTSLVRQQTIDPNNVVAYFLDLWTEGDYIMGKFRGSNLAIGEAFDQDLRDGFKPAWSLRALGSINNTSRGAEVESIKVITWDRVYYPSHPEAYTQKVLESAGINGDAFEQGSSGLYVPKTPTPKCSNSMNESGLLNPVTNQKVIDYIKTESTNLKSVIENFEIYYDDIKLLDECNLQLSNSKTGTVFIVQPEKFIKQNIMDFCTR